MLDDTCVTIMYFDSEKKPIEMVHKIVVARSCSVRDAHDYALHSSEALLRLVAIQSNMHGVTPLADAITQVMEHSGTMPIGRLAVTSNGWGKLMDNDAIHICLAAAPRHSIHNATTSFFVQKLYTHLMFVCPSS